jgi:hypothetical protein
LVGKFQAQAQVIADVGVEAGMMEELILVGR